MRDAEEFGFDSDQQASMEEDFVDVERENTYDVWAQNWPVLEVFLAVQTQWRTAGMSGVRVGLDYPAVESAIRMMGRAEDAPELFAGVRAMEYEAIAVFSQQAKRK